MTIHAMAKMSWLCRQHKLRYYILQGSEDDWDPYLSSPIGTTIPVPRTTVQNLEQQIQELKWLCEQAPERASLLSLLRLKDYIGTRINEYSTWNGEWVNFMKLVPLLLIVLFYASIAIAQSYTIQEPGRLPTYVRSSSSGVTISKPGELPVRVSTNSRGGATISTPGHLPTYVRPTSGGGVSVDNPGQLPVTITPTTGGGATINTPGQLPTRIRLASGWLTCLYRTGIEPLDCSECFSFLDVLHHLSFLPILRVYQGANSGVASGQ
jgi:hypothetical protein